MKPGDGSAREQAASCQKVLGGWANIANEYATKRYRSNLINWGMLPFITEEDHESLSFQNGDYIFVPDIKKAVAKKLRKYCICGKGEELKEVTFKLGDNDRCRKRDHHQGLPDQLLSRIADLWCKEQIGII